MCYKYSIISAYTLLGQVVDDFMREATLARSLKDPHIVEVKGICVVPPALCLVMERLPQSLHQLLHSKRFLSLKEKLSLCLGNVLYPFVYSYNALQNSCNINLI